MSEIDPKIPITMLPVRIETRFAGTPAAPRLLVRLYPDDAHIDHHDRRLTKGEVLAGKRYWTSIRTGTAGDQVWAQLLKDVGATRAIWVRQALTPTNASGAPTFPEVATVEGNAGIAATARALPAFFIVRVRFAGGMRTVQGRAIPTSLQVGISFGSAPPDAAPAPPTAGGDATLVLDEGMRWMVDFDAAVAVGMAVSVDLPPQTGFIQDVVAVGMPVANADGAALFTALIEAHRFSDGAAFIPPGTPTNNLADSASGYSVTAVPAPGPLVAPADGSVAAALAAAWSIDPMVLAPIENAASRELDEARPMGRALFEATWGSYLRQQAQPGIQPESSAAGLRARDVVRPGWRTTAGHSTRPAAVRRRADHGPRRLGSGSRKRIRAVACEFPSGHQTALDLWNCKRAIGARAVRVRTGIDARAPPDDQHERRSRLHGRHE